MCGESLSRCVEAADEKEVRGGGDGQEGGGEGGAAAKLFSYPRHYDETEPDAKMRTPNTELTLGTEKRKKLVTEEKHPATLTQQQKKPKAIKLPKPYFYIRTRQHHIIIYKLIP